MDATTNYFGLAYQGAEVAHAYVTGSGVTNLVVTGLATGGTYTRQYANELDTFYTKTAQPSFETAGYYFARPYFDPLPSEYVFSVTNTSPELIEPLGVPGYPVTAWAREQLLNGNANVFTYVGTQGKPQDMKFAPKHPFLDLVCSDNLLANPENYSDIMSIRIRIRAMNAIKIALGLLMASL